MIRSWDYLASWFDGDGSVFSKRGKPCINIFNTDREIVTAIRSFLGVGHLKITTTPPPPPIPNRRTPKLPMHSFKIYRQSDVARILSELNGRCIVKADAIASAIGSAWGSQSGNHGRLGNLTWEYVAGFFDADGCISCAKATKRIMVDFSNTNHSVLESLFSFLKVKEIKSLIRTSRIGNLKWETLYVLNVYNIESIHILCRAIAPICITKQNAILRYGI